MASMYHQPEILLTSCLFFCIYRSCRILTDIHQLLHIIDGDETLVFCLTTRILLPPHTVLPVPLPSKLGLTTNSEYRPLPTTIPAILPPSIAVPFLHPSYKDTSVFYYLRPSLKRGSLKVVSWGRRRLSSSSISAQIETQISRFGHSQLATLQ